jgi:hypothetical protein
MSENISLPQFTGPLDRRFDNIRKFARDNFVAHDDVRTRFDMLVDQLRIDSQPKENQILLTFGSKEELDFVFLVARRKGYHLPNYLLDNIEWDDKLNCLVPEIPAKPSKDICDGCDFIGTCPDAVKKSDVVQAVKKVRGRS